MLLKKCKNMQIELLQLVDGANKASGLTVIIDVFRAFSTACYAVNNGAARLIPVETVEMALKIKEKNPEFILLGERGEKKCEGFDFGNSPTHILHQSFDGKTLVHTTSSGTLGIAKAQHASEIVTGSFVNAKAIVRYIQQKNPSMVSLVCMGYEARYETQEDTFCAQYIRNELLGIETNFNGMIELLKIGDGARLLNPNNHAHSPASDFDLCLDLNRFDFILKAKPSEFGIELEKIII
jgi:2-phosphosulfolactate phosphatase